MKGSVSMNNSPAVIDTNVFSNFALTGNIQIIKTLYAHRLYIPTTVIAECVSKSMLYFHINQALQEGWIEEYSLSLAQTPQEFLEYAKLRKSCHEGESAVLAIAKIRGFTVISDDMKAVRKFCQENNLKLRGTLGILFEAYKHQLINQSEGDKILNDMILKNNYISPVRSMQEVIDWFEYGKGRELF